MGSQSDFYQNKLDFEMDAFDLYKALERGESVIPLDARQTTSFHKEHIPGAINIPHREINEATTRLLDKSALYVCYCDGIGCNASTWGALNMTKMGFNVRELIGGIVWWKFDGYPTEGENPSESSGPGCAC